MYKKACWTLGVLFLAAALLALPVPAQAEMYVEAYLGGVTSSGLNDSTTVTTSLSSGAFLKANLPGGANPTVIGGLKIGTWFVPTGFLGYSYPDWMKYFGIYTDFSFHRLDVDGNPNIRAYFNNNLLISLPGTFRTEGTVATWAFMLAGRYGFFPDSEVPFGRLQPYVAAGPAIVFTTQQVKMTVPNTPIGPFAVSPGSQGSVNIGLAVDAGIRYMALKNVSIDLSFKYRYTQPRYEYSGQLSNPINFNVPVNFKYEPVYHLFSGQLGVAYHF